MLKSQQIKLVHVAARRAGLIGPEGDGRYRLMLRQYLNSAGGRLTSCKQLSNWQLDDFLGICESLGWRAPGKPEDYYRQKSHKKEFSTLASFAQKEALLHLAGDLGWNDENLKGMLKRMTLGRAELLAELTRKEVYMIIEAMKSMVLRTLGIKQNKPLSKVMEGLEAAKDGTSKIGQ